MTQHKRERCGSKSFITIILIVSRIFWVYIIMSLTAWLENWSAWFVNLCNPDFPLLLPLFSFGRCCLSNTKSGILGNRASLHNLKNSSRSSGFSPVSVEFSACVYQILALTPTQ